MLACIRDGMGVRNWIVGPVTYGISLPPGEPIRVFHEIATAAENQIIKDYWVFKNTFNKPKQFLSAKNDLKT